MADRCRREVFVLLCKKKKKRCKAQKTTWYEWSLCVHSRVRKTCFFFLRGSYITVEVWKKGRVEGRGREVREKQKGRESGRANRESRTRETQKEEQRRGDRWQRKWVITCSGNTVHVCLHTRIRSVTLVLVLSSLFFSLWSVNQHPLFSIAIHLSPPVPPVLLIVSVFPPLPFMIASKQSSPDRCFCQWDSSEECGSEQDLQHHPRAFEKPLVVMSACVCVTTYVSRWLNWCSSRWCYVSQV